MTISVFAHAALLVLLYYLGGFSPEPRVNQVPASSAGTASVVSTARRLQDLQAIKELMEKSAGREAAPEPETDPAAEFTADPGTPREMVERARELSRAIDALDEEIRAVELSRLLEAPVPLPEPEALTSATPPAVDDVASPGDEAGPEMTSGLDDISPEMAAREVAALEAKARHTLLRRQQYLAAQAQGLPVHGPRSGEGQQGSDKTSASHGPDAGGNSSVLAEMGDFIGERGLAPGVPKSNYRTMRFFHFGAGEIPRVDVTRLVRGRGRMFGAGGEYANRVYLNTWYIIGPFAGRHGPGLFDNPIYPPEQAVLLDAVYEGKDGRLLRWRYVTARNYPLVPPDSVEDAVYYGYTEVHLDAARDLTAWIGADDDVQIHLNGELVWLGGNINKQWYFNAVFFGGGAKALLRDYNRTEGRRVLHFRKGRNTLFFKLSNGPDHAFLSMVLTP